MESKINNQIDFNLPNGHSDGLAQKPGIVAFGQIVVTRGNPSRGKGFEISHFIRRNGSVRSVSRLDVFLPSMRKASAWVHRYYPGAILVARRRNHFGQVSALSFECSLCELLPASRGGRR